jgi:hypothetical protein
MLAKQERQAIARRLFEAMRAHFPDRYIEMLDEMGISFCPIDSSLPTMKTKLKDLGVAGRELIVLYQNDAGENSLY